MPMDMPPVEPQRPAFVAPAPECHYLSQAEAQVALRRLKQTLVRTSFADASPSEICGMVRVKLKSGATVYTDATGRYLLLAFALDTHKGSPADVEDQMEAALAQRQADPVPLNLLTTAAQEAAQGIPEAAKK